MFNLIFPVDNGMLDGMSGTQLVAEYSLMQRKLIWKDRTETKEKTEKLVYLVLGLLPLSSPLFIIPILSIMNRTNEFNIVSSLGYKNTILWPIIIGVLLEIIFHIYISRTFAKLGNVIEQPELDVRTKYITEMIDVSFRRNVPGKSFPPYLIAVGSILVLSLTIPVVYYLIMSDVDSIANVTMMFVVLSILWFAVFFVLFEGVLRHIVMVRFEKKWKKELAEEIKNG